MRARPGDESSPGLLLGWRAGATSRRLAAHACIVRLDEVVWTQPVVTFDAEEVFAACAESGTAVEINCRPERLDPPRGLLRPAVESGVLFSVDTDAHAPGLILSLGCSSSSVFLLMGEMFVVVWLVVIAPNLFLLSKQERRERYAAIFQNSSTPGYPVQFNGATRLESHDCFIFGFIFRRGQHQM